MKSEYIYIDQQLFKEMLIAGANKLESNKEIVDSLNVFPVPDGDTGTNMSLTMQSAVKEIKKMKNGSLGEIASSAAHGSLMGARGNSGVILSQLLRGLASSVKDKEKINTRDLAKAIKMASDTAYKAVMKPVEGTILTIARESADYALRIAQKEKNMLIFMEQVILHAKETLQKTPDMLKVLKEAGVVDSGGKGLIYIFEGALEAISGQMISAEDLDMVAGDVKVVDSDEHEDSNIKFGYCTEFIINTGIKNPDIEKLKDTMQVYGDSMLVVGSDELIKVHIHTNNPGQVLEEGLKLGYLQDIKIDNMRLQHRNLEDMENKESTYNIPKKKYGFITVAKGKGLVDIFKDFDIDHVIEGGQTMNPSTEDFLKAIEDIEAETIIILPNNSNIIMAANQVKEISDKNIIVIPTKTIPQGIAALMAFNLENSPEENEEEMNEIIKTVKTGEITYAVRNTSFNDIQIKKDDILGIGDSEIQSVGKDIFKTTIDLLERMVTEDSEIITVFYGEDIEEEEAEKLVEKIEEIYTECDVELYYGGQPLYYYIISIE